MVITFGFMRQRLRACGISESAFLAQHGLAGKTVEQIVDTIDQTPQSRPLPYSASITSTELKLSDGEQIYTLPLGDKFYLSFAPYEWRTHPCFNHSLSGCRGEMPNKPFTVKVTDSKGAVIVQKRCKAIETDLSVFGYRAIWKGRWK